MHNTKIIIIIKITCIAFVLYNLHLHISFKRIYKIYLLIRFYNFLEFKPGMHRIIYIATTS